MISCSRDSVTDSDITPSNQSQWPSACHYNYYYCIRYFIYSQCWLYFTKYVLHLWQFFVSLLDQSSRVVCLTASHSSDKSLFVQWGLCWPNLGLVWLWIFYQPLHRNQFFSLTSCDRYSITQTHTHRHMHTASLLMNTQLVSQPDWLLTLIDSTELAYWWCLAPCNSGSTWPRYRPGQLILRPVALNSTWIEQEHHACLVSLILIWSSDEEPNQTKSVVSHSLPSHSHFY